jgi:DNA-binding CsgD family transcriptional regulator
LGYGGFLIDCKRRVLAHNRIAFEFLGDGLTLQGERVAATDHESDARLQSLIETAVKPSESPNGPASVGLRRDVRLPLLVRVLRLSEDGRPPVNSEGLLLVASDPELRQVPPAHMLSELFSLTDAEASVAVGIAGGQQLAEIAADRGVKFETIRVHSKRVFGKTHTRGQAELAALLTRLAFLASQRS